MNEILACLLYSIGISTALGLLMCLTIYLSEKQNNDVKLGTGESNE